MRRRIVVLAMLAATLATSLFGIPLALYAARYYRVYEGNKVERAANRTAIAVAGDLFHGRYVGQLATLEPGTGVAIYTPDGRFVVGEGPPVADAVVNRTLTDNRVHRATGDGQVMAAVPIRDGPRVVYVVRADSSISNLHLQILRTWVLMLVLEAGVLVLTWQLARWQARRLARPLEDLATAAGTLGDGDFSVRAGSSGIPEIDAAGAALNQTAARLGDLVERERAITANASHQLRTPLTGLRLGLEAALDSPQPDYRQTIVDAVATTERLGDTIEDLIALARNKAQVTERLDLDSLLKEVSDTWGARLAAAGRELQVSADPHLPPCLASVAAVRQILAVLVDNAVQHGVGTVTVHARDASAATAVDVTDEGTGLGDDHTDLLDRRGTESPEGTGSHGIGLSLARDLADAEGGRLRLSSRAPTTFTLFLPAALPPD